MTTTKRVPTHLQNKTPLRNQYRSAHERHGKREEPPKGKSNNSIVRLVICAMLLAIVIGVKLTAPDVVEKYRGKILELMGENTDFVETFSSIGRAIGEKDIMKTINDAYVAVFGGGAMEETEEAAAVDRNAVIYDRENTPQQATMFQQVLGFDYKTPISGTLTSSFGYRDHPVDSNERFHYGIDIAAQIGEVIHAFADGKVTAIGESSDLGKYVELLHDNGYMTLYAHCSKVNASSGQRVKMGDPIAEVGDTGEATGAHLHFALYQDTLYLNPIYYVTL